MWRYVKIKIDRNLFKCTLFKILIFRVLCSELKNKTTTLFKKIRVKRNNEKYKIRVDCY